jgi:MYXO-CTERM domain-containing protein
VRVFLGPLVLACSLGLFATVASAGEKNPDVQACAAKKAGDACQRTVVTKPEGGPAEEKKLPGVCAQDECCELDYSKGSPPETVCGPCLACKEGPGTPGPSAEGGAEAGSAAAADAGRPNDGGAPAVAGAESDGSPPATDPSKRGCTVGAPTTGAANWMALAGLVLLARRRRRG